MMKLPVVREVFRGVFDATFDLVTLMTMAENQEYAEGLPAEGIVIKTIEGEPRITFKVISNLYLLKYRL